MPDGGTAGLGWLALETFGRSALGSEPPQTCPHPAFPQILHFGASMSNSLSNVSNSFLFCFVAEARDGACTVTFHLAYWDPAVPIRPLSARPHFGPIPALKIKGVEWLLCELWLTYAVSSVPHTAIRAYSSSYSGLAAVWTRSKPHLQPLRGSVDGAKTGRFTGLESVAHTSTHLQSRLGYAALSAPTCTTSVAAR
jgi:hypothetical protein